MKLTVFTDYSLRVLMYLAVAPDRRATVAEISQAFGIKPNHLTKVVHRLGKQGWVATARGKGGGLSLARPAEAISIGQVVRDAEGFGEPAECFTAGGHCEIANCCRLMSVLGEAMSAFHAVLDRYTLDDVVRNRDQLASILHFHAPFERTS
jgi:Rrf2 family nitric oxide-sensitive transcriptional repressor